jgi:hypothetical protein
MATMMKIYEKNVKNYSKCCSVQYHGLDSQAWAATREVLGALMQQEQQY